MSLVLATVLQLMYPDFLFNKYKDLFFGYLGKTSMNVLCTIVHVLPIYLFKDRQKLKELLDPKIIFYSFLLLLTYYVFFKKKLSAVYPATEIELFYMAVTYFLIFSVFSILENLHLISRSD